MFMELTGYGFDDTIKHSIELLEEALQCKSKSRKDKLMHQVVGELDTLFRCVLIYTEKGDETDDSTTKETVSLVV